MRRVAQEALARRHRAVHDWVLTELVLVTLQADARLELLEVFIIGTAGLVAGVTLVFCVRLVDERRQLHDLFTGRSEFVRLIRTKRRVGVGHSVEKEVESAVSTLGRAAEEAEE